MEGRRNGRYMYIGRKRRDLEGGREEGRVEEREGVTDVKGEIQRGGRYSDYSHTILILTVAQHLILCAP